MRTNMTSPADRRLSDVASGAAQLRRPADKANKKNLVIAVDGSPATKNIAPRKAGLDGACGPRLLERCRERAGVPWSGPEQGQLVKRIFVKDRARLAGGAGDGERKAVQDGHADREDRTLLACDVEAHVERRRVDA